MSQHRKSYWNNHLTKWGFITKSGNSLRYQLFLCTPNETQSCMPTWISEEIWLQLLTHGGKPGHFVAVLASGIFYAHVGTMFCRCSRVSNCLAHTPNDCQSPSRAARTPIFLLGASTQDNHNHDSNPLLLSTALWWPRKAAKWSGV